MTLVRRRNETRGTASSLHQLILRKSCRLHACVNVEIRRVRKTPA